MFNLGVNIKTVIGTVHGCSYVVSATVVLHFYVIQAPRSGRSCPEPWLGRRGSATDGLEPAQPQAIGRPGRRTHEGWRTRWLGHGWPGASAALGQGMAWRR